jgi:hypothetical protein
LPLTPFWKRPLTALLGGMMSMSAAPEPALI